MIRRTVLLVLVALGSGVGPSRASEPPRETLPAVGVEIVKIDAVVTDKQGQPVPGLVAADFEIREDGKVQELSVFTVEGRPDEGEAEAAPPPPVPAAAAAMAPALPRRPKARGRQIVIAVDDLHIAPSNLVSARAALLRFVDEQLADDDEVALVTTSGTVGLSQALTRDRASLRRALERLNLLQQRRVETNEIPHLTEYQAELIDRGDAFALRLAVQEIRQENPDIDEPMARSQAANRARTMLVEIMNYSGQSLIALEGVVRGLAPLSGRKIVVLISDGFLVGLGANDTRHYDLRRIVDAATRSGTVVYALDTRGLVSEVPGTEPAEVTLQAQIWSGDKLQGGGPTHEVAFAEAGALSPRQAERIALEPLPPGEYELRIVANDRKSGQSAERRLIFTLE